MSWKDLAAMPWDLWRRQVAAILRLELKKNLWTLRAWWIYLLALGPVILTGAHTVIELYRPHGNTLAEDSMVFAGMFQLFYLRLGIFFGCVGIFTNLFRGEVLERTLHYYLLSPVRREVLAVAKYVAGLAAAALFFATSVAASFVLISLHLGTEFREHVFRGPGLEHLAWYVLVAVLACAGYGAVFLFLGMVFRNPMLPATLVMIWEGINPFLPSVLKKASVIFYLKSLCPVSLPPKGVMALIAVETAPTPAWLAIPGLVLVVAAVLTYAAHRARGFEVSYSE